MYVFSITLRWCKPEIYDSIYPLMRGWTEVHGNIGVQNYYSYALHDISI